MRCGSEGVHRTERSRRMCAVRKSKKYRTEGMFMICTVRNAKKLPYGRQVYELYGTKSEKVTVQAVCL